VSKIMQTETTKVGRSRRSWLWVVPALGALAAGVAVSPGARAEPPDSGDMGGPGPGHHFAKRMERVLDRVNATPGQRAQIRAVWDGLRPQLRALHQQKAELRRQMISAMTAPKIDGAAVEKLRVQQIGLHDKTSALMTQGFVGSANVLTPEQRKLARDELERHGHGRGRFGPPVP
jgi:Spy/CpxP family protein refolding chaperone